MAGDDDILDSPDGLNEAERAEFAQMQDATTGAVGQPDAGAADPGADAGAAAGADAGAAGAAGAADPGAAGGADPGAAAAAAAAAAGAAAAADGTDDDDDDDAGPELGADGKPALTADGKPRPRRKVRVSLNKFQAEKDRADKATADLTESNLRMARADERLRLLNEALTAPKPGDKKEGAAAEEDQEPDPEQDAFGWMKWSRARTAKLEKAITDIQQGKQTEDGEKVVANAYMQDATEYAGKEPNFVPAYNHLMNSRKQELAMYFYGIDLTDQAQAAKVTRPQWHKISSIAEGEERGIVENAIAQGRSPAQAVYAMSRYRGYQPQTREQFAAAAEARRVAAGGAPAAAAAAKPAANGKAANGAAETGGKAASTVADEIERIKAGSEAALSLSDGGASPANPLTAQRLADMPQAEFEALMNSVGDDSEAFRRIVEGQA